MASTSSPTSALTDCKYHVILSLLSFQGEDDRYSVIFNLYEALVQAGISTFIGDDEIPTGLDPNQEIERSITESRASVIVVSNKYAESNRCLDELLLILKKKRRRSHFVLPVFYHVELSDVKEQRRSFMLEPKDTKWTEDNVNRWKAALIEVGNLSRMVVSGSGTASVEDIVDIIINRKLHSMSSSFDSEFEHLRIHLSELKRATNNFGSKVIGVGGFGKVYKGEVSHSKGRSMVAIKRLSRGHGQGDPEFWKEIMMLSRVTHKNLISLLGFCDEDGEKILVYEHAFNGSLDSHLSSTSLTWTQRLKICLDVARGLACLHDHKGTQQRVIHRDIKSANILLDERWNAKLSDMGLSKIGPANQLHTVLITNIVGTPGYCDPQYMETYTLTKESDVYSFGVVLFEVLCGRLCYKSTKTKLEISVPMWKQSYMDKKLDQIIFKDLTPPMDPICLEAFSDVAFQCLHYSREQRPTMCHLVQTLELALEFQECYEMNLTNAVGTPQSQRVLLSKGKGVFPDMSKRLEDPKHG